MSKKIELKPVELPGCKPAITLFDLTTDILKRYGPATKVSTNTANTIDFLAGGGGSRHSKDDPYKEK